MNVTAQHIVIRNNVMMNGTAAVAVAGHPLLPKNFVDQLFIYNNTAYFFPTTYPVDYGATLVSIGGTTGSMVVENNIFAHGLTLTNEQTAFINTDKMATVTENHNLGYAPKGQGTWKPGTGAGDIVGNPMFVSTDPTNANAFHLAAGSAAADVGRVSAGLSGLRRFSATLGRRVGHRSVRAPVALTGARRASRINPIA